MSRVGLFGQISEINGHLYLSGAGVLRPDRLKEKKITCVINVTNEEPSAYMPGIDYLKIRIDDNPYAHLDHYFDMVADKINAIRERGGRTLVHCMAGVSRSASLCIVYLIKYERMTLLQAYHYVKAARPIIRPNVGFFKQMVEYERKLRGHNSVMMVQIEGCDLLVPDIYANELRRQVAYRSALSNVNARNDDDSRAERAKSAALPMEYAKRRGLSVGNADSHRYRSSMSNGSPWRHVASLSLLSTAPTASRRPRQENLFGNLYASRGAFFSAF
ncbi:hypothetical protein M3Y96_00023200 [Aphelenchoides besseyi]|nr:hypothetical protein M3Y96_00023200 [Aphelenchoides besseyi]